MKEHIVRIQDVVGLLHALYPPALAESWDNVGLQAGDPAARVERVLVCLDPSEAALAEAERLGAQALISHHPLLLKPLKRLSPQDETGRVLFRAIRAGIAVISAHTNLDRGRDGLNDWLAALLGLERTEPLALGDDALLKLAVFVPAGYEDRVAAALFKAGAGQVGHYDGCSFRGDGIGTFRPGDGTSPFIGRTGRLERVREVRLETVLPRELRNRVVQRMLKAHPYEEVAYDLVPLANCRPDVGLGRIGCLEQPVRLDAFADRVKERLVLSAVRVVGQADHRVRKVAVCGGSGASLLGEAERRGADVLVTGDVKYHEALGARSRGLALIDAGHFGTERIMVERLAAALRRAADSRHLEMEFAELKGEEDPFTVV